MANKRKSPTAKKKIVRAEDITEKDIISLYDKVLPLLYNNPQNIDVSYALNRVIYGFVQYDFGHYLVDDTNDHPGKLRTLFEKWGDPSSEKDFSDILTVTLKNEDLDSAFDELVERSYQKAITGQQTAYPDHLEFHYYRIVSKEKPNAMVGFFRNKKIETDNSFTKEDIRIFKKLTPHILIILRTVMSFGFQSRTYQYFNTHVNISSSLVKKFSLSGMEYKIVMEILFGYSNEEIAERNYISVPTVKSHIQHIFKKTGVKNRVDFLSKFFTSPERIEL